MLAPSDPPSSSVPPPAAAASDAPPAPARGWWGCARGIVRTIRPHQWFKNLFVLAPVVFAKHLMDPVVIRGAIGAFVIFCLLAGAVYTLNDLVDVAADRVHPVKRHRPIASGVVPTAAAKILVGVLLLASALGSLLLPLWFGVVAASYLVQNVAYSFRLKKIAYLDVSCIALGFVLRVLAGGFATATPVSGYMIACTVLLALFLGFGKRRHELGSAAATKQRQALRAYGRRALAVALAVTGVASVATYLAYTLDPATRELFQFQWLWLTTIHPLYGVVRFLQLVAGRPKAESPTQEMLRDSPFMLNLAIWTAEVMVIVYHLRPT